MIYPEDLFVSIESDRQIFLYKDTGPEFSIFLSKLDKLINEQLSLVNQMNLGSNIEEILENLYKNNYVLFGMTRIYEIHKLNHLFEILNFVFDLTRKIGTIREHSSDYLIKLLYDKSILMIDELNSKNTISIDISDLIEESKNYLYPQLISWNDKFKNPNINNNKCIPSRDVYILYHFKM
jgi:hypothetical protein